MKRRIFWSVFFTVFFRLPIYESIAAIFWQSASYVINFIGVIFEARNETREKIWSDFGAEQK